MMIYCHEHVQGTVTQVLEDHGLKRMNFRFDHQGATVLLNVASFDHLWVEPYAGAPSQEGSPWARERLATNGRRRH